MRHFNAARCSGCASRSEGYDASPSPAAESGLVQWEPSFGAGRQRSVPLYGSRAEEPVGAAATKSGSESRQLD